uniref:Uncharacterized protein n=1 Tax=Physcomitrium patens TaxID=3218 RepID=A0A2K1ICD4_PHYPA|nr:hypothetical protein PHYPA_030415 [Physcomitrium patens]
MCPSPPCQCLLRPFPLVEQFPINACGDHSASPPVSLCKGLYMLEIEREKKSKEK